MARQKKINKLYNIELVYANQIVRTVQVRASSREIAEKRALKRNPAAIGVKPRA